MSSGTLRRRVHHEDVGGKKYERIDSSGSDGLSEPLLSHEIYDNANRTYSEDDFEDLWKDKRRKEEQAWGHIFSRLIAQWAQWFSNAFSGSGAWVGCILHRVVFRRPGNGEKIHIDLTPMQEECLHKLQERLEVPFDGTRSEHQEALIALWQAAFPDRTFRGLVSEQWKDMGWQGTDPSTDFRGGGYVSLENLLFFAKHFPQSFHRLLHKEEGKRAAWEYPFAVAGINISFMLTQMLDLRSAKPSSVTGFNFLKILAEDETAFDTLFCVAFEMMDAQWLAMHASYMEFNAVLRATRAQLERELSLEDVTRVQDLPAYNLLCH
ncbi:hypothetical protein O6H91_20G017200 [Diphasiastrum complanatum]|uniref:Uncharacterized protein n=2 Tax=Diphasiastrum complanatum TaxID=34168 RepID=A0ACC2AN06_DIPCM|nr:hypothetical protein O6H91_20G017200 [Diphasiastrum complanatum]KAJ7518968.1 hypothetical protein O6H91_20G017200 [Diphasiastrum complanatum]